MKKLFILLFLSLSLSAPVLADSIAGYNFFRDGNYKAAAREWRKEAIGGSSYGQYNLGGLYEYGQGVSKDLERAFYWYEKSAKQGYKEAQYNLGRLYEYGKGVSKDLKKAFDWYERSSNQGYVEAQNNLGRLYEYGKGVPKDLEFAFYWYERSAKQGDKDAQFNLGVMYKNGQGVPKDLKKAFDWYEKSAKQGNKEAQNNLGNSYFNGQGVPKDLKKAFDWFEKSAKQGSRTAQFNLGNSYYYGQGVPKDLNKAFDWYEKSANQGDKDAQFNLGNSYYYGQGVPKDLKKAFDWYEKSAKQGNKDAKNNLGRLYEYGQGGPKDLKKAFDWYEKSAKHGSRTAQFNLGRLYEYGKGVPKDLKKAFYWYERSANQGDKDAQFNLGDMYKNGQGVPKDLKKAFDWYEKSAKQGGNNAQVQLELQKAKKDMQQRLWVIFALVVLALLFLWRLMTRGKREAERLRLDKIENEKVDAILEEVKRKNRAEEEEKQRIQALAIQDEKDRIYALQQKKLVYLKADKYLSEFETHLPFKLSADYSDLRIIYDEDASSTQTDFIENFKDNRLWDMLISLLVGDHPLDMMSTIYFVKIRSLLDDEDYLVIGETSLEINEFFDRSTQLELVDTISTCLMPKPIALFVLLHLSREFRYPNEEERAETEFKLEHFIVKENARVKIQKLFTKLEMYANKCVDSYADISSKGFDQLEFNQENDYETQEEDFEIDEEAINKAVKNTKLPKN